MQDSIKTSLFIMLVVVLTLAGCATTTPVSVHLRGDVDTSKSKVVAFPMLLWDGKKLNPANASYSNPVADAFLGSTWTEYLGKENVTVIPKIAVDKIPGANSAIDILVKALDQASALEQTAVLTSFLDIAGKQFGDGALAFALVTQDKKGYDQTKAVQVNMGLFDTKKLAWKWVTRHSRQGGMIPIPYEKVVRDLVAESFAALKEKNGGMAR